MGKRIYDEIVGLRSKSMVATRAVIAEITNQQMSVVDYHVKRLVSDGKLRRVLNGVYEPVPQSVEDRAVSFTQLPSSACKLEIGDTVLELTWTEVRMVHYATAGPALQFSNVVSSQAK